MSLFKELSRTIRKHPDPVDGMTFTLVRRGVGRWTLTRTEELQSGGERATYTTVLDAHAGKLTVTTRLNREPPHTVYDKKHIAKTKKDVLAQLR